MWLISKKNDLIPYQDSISLIDCGCELEGSFRFLETLLLRGKLKGMSIYADTLRVTETGVLEAEGLVKNVILDGKLLGNITVTERMELRRTARATGNISTPLLIIEEGAKLTGDVKIMGQPADVVHVVDDDPGAFGTFFTPVVEAGCSLYRLA